MLRVLVFILMAFSFGCNNKVAVEGKSLFSSWERDGHTIDLSQGSIGTFSSKVTLPLGHECQTSMEMKGDEVTGSYAISASTYVEGTGLPKIDPGCSTLVAEGLYEQAGPYLILCEQGLHCDDYQ